MKMVCLDDATTAESVWREKTTFGRVWSGQWAVAAEASEQAPESSKDVSSEDEVGWEVVSSFCHRSGSWRMQDMSQGPGAARCLALSTGATPGGRPAAATVDWCMPGAPPGVNRPPTQSIEHQATNHAPTSGGLRACLSNPVQIMHNLNSGASLLPIAAQAMVCQG
jgi:hypothetical protein